ncbi:ABC transporter permease [Candidatus Gracilibacteria bacterium]|nr:ABC transporter permease [Candidatus Gracilibacteria bacterium]
MFEPLIRLSSFLTKEIAEVVRQPRLILSLILGPFLVLLLFGVGYSGDRPLLRTAMVLPESGSEIDPDVLRQLVGTNFTLVEEPLAEEQALDMLRNNALDVVQVLPSDIRQRVLAGEQPSIRFYSNSINPLDEQWIQYLAYAEVNEINKAILLQSTGETQAEARAARDEIAATREQLLALESGLAQSDPQELQASVRRLRDTTGLLLASPFLLRDDAEAADLRAELQQLQSDLTTIDESISNGDLDQQQQRIVATRQRLDTVDEQLALFADLPPQAIVSPLQPAYENLRGAPYDLMTFYIPAVLALLVQHIAVALGSLSIVRERLLGTMEYFRVAPVSMFQMVVGKYLAYTLFVAVIAGVLLALMQVLNIPFAGSPGCLPGYCFCSRWPRSVWAFGSRCSRHQRARRSSSLCWCCGCRSFLAASSCP